MDEVNNVLLKVSFPRPSQKFPRLSEKLLQTGIRDTTSKQPPALSLMANHESENNDDTVSEQSHLLVDQESIDDVVKLGESRESVEQPITTWKELWSYHLYYNGNNRVGPGSYSQTL